MFARRVHLTLHTGTALPPSVTRASAFPQAALADGGRTVE